MGTSHQTHHAYSSTDRYVCRNSLWATGYAKVNKYLHVRSQLIICSTVVVAKINTGRSVVLNLARPGRYKYIYIYIYIYRGICGRIGQVNDVL